MHREKQPEVAGILEVFREERCPAQGSRSKSGLEAALPVRTPVKVVNSSGSRSSGGWILGGTDFVLEWVTVALAQHDPLAFPHHSWQQQCSLARVALCSSGLSDWLRNTHWSILNHTVTLGKYQKRYFLFPSGLEPIRIKAEASCHEGDVFGRMEPTQKVGRYMERQQILGVLSVHLDSYRL